MQAGVVFGLLTQCRWGELFVALFFVVLQGGGEAEEIGTPVEGFFVEKKRKDGARRLQKLQDPRVLRALPR